MPQGVRLTKVRTFASSNGGLLACVTVASEEPGDAAYAEALGALKKLE